MTFIEGSIPLTEVAKALGIKVAQVETECRELDLYIGRDWAGRAAVAEVDAESLVSGAGRAAREDDARWAAHLRDCEDWARRRDEAVKAAHDAVGADPRSGPEKHSQARDAATEAGRDFEFTTGPPLWGGEECGNAVRRYSERDVKPWPAGLLDKARDILAGAPR